VISGIWAVSGSVKDVNAALAAARVVPQTNNDLDVTINTHIEDAVGAGPADGVISLNVTPQNDDPTLDQALADQNATEDSSFSFTFAANSFSDVDSGDSLTYSAFLSGGASLPTWLNFNANSRTFSGTPVNADVGTVSVEVFADDGRGGNPVSDIFNIVIANTNDAPTVVRPIPDYAATEDLAFSFSVSPITFSDADIGDTLSYSATLSDGSALPAWLSFDSSSRTFSGTPANGDVGTISVEVTADDSNGGTASDSFNIVVANTNDAPLGSVTINGVLGEGETLTADTSTLSDDDGIGILVFQWQQNGVDILGANAATYDIQAGDIGNVLSVKVSYTDGAGSVEEVNSASVSIPNQITEPEESEVEV